MTNFPVRTPTAVPTRPVERPTAGRAFPGQEILQTPHEVPSKADQPGAVVLQVEGVVIPGDQRGRLLGFPTANVAVAAHQWRDGVWAGTVQIDPAVNGPVHVAAVSVGHRPTYYGKNGPRLLEAHLLDFSGDLYGRRVLVRLHVRLRPQRRYPGSKELTEQLHTDVIDTRAWASGDGHTHSRATPEAASTQPTRSGRRYPVRKKQRHSPEDVKQRQEQRNQKRETLIGAAVLGLSRQGHPLTYDLVAQRTGLPLGFLRSRYPTPETLMATAQQAH
ncbi:riboflavin kinase [Kocuria sp. M4R2S49]|uniref:riboflavin kinase n=1 Tax=Kocuria rhizosphaericola TaxID=3376284 RepID=UPI0037B022C2